jgi:hypothetical protein
LSIVTAEKEYSSKEIKKKINRREKNLSRERSATIRFLLFVIHLPFLYCFIDCLPSGNPRNVAELFGVLAKNNHFTFETVGYKRKLLSLSYSLTASNPVI